MNNIFFNESVFGKNDIVEEYNERLEFKINSNRLTLDDLVEIAIENELTDVQNKCIKLFYYDRLTVSEIARLMNLHRSVVYRHLESAEKKLFLCLKYLYAFCRN